MRSLFRQKDNDFTQGPLFGRILIYAIPLMLSGILQLLYNAADSIVVGHYCGTESLAAVGSTGAMITLTVNLFLGLAVGVKVMVAQGIGAHRPRDVYETVHTAVLVSVLVGIAVGVFGFFSARQLLIWMSSPDDVLDLATLYMKIYFIGMPANLLYNFGSSILQAAGDTKRPLYILFASGIVNVVLNLVLVICFQMDVAGVAIATIVSQLLSAIGVLLCLVRTPDVYQVHLRELRIYPAKLWEMTKLGLPAGLQGSIFSISNIMIQSSINLFGSKAMAGNSAAGNLDGFIYQSMVALYHAAITFTGQNVGAHKYERIGKITRACLIMVTAVGVGMGALVFALHQPLLHIYSKDAEVLSYGTLRLEVMCATYFLCGCMDVMCGQLRGMGKSTVPMVVSILGVCGIRMVWIWTVFQWEHNLTCLYLSYTFSWAATALAHFICYIIIKHRLLKQSALNGAGEEPQAASSTGT